MGNLISGALDSIVYCLTSPKVLGLRIPPSLLARADQAIE